MIHNKILLLALLHNTTRNRKQVPRGLTTLNPKLDTLEQLKRTTTKNIQDKIFTIPPLIKHKTRQNPSVMYKVREQYEG
jgi:hypothetical protein